MNKNFISRTISALEIDNADQEVIEYGLIQGINSLLGIVFILLVGTILGILSKSILFTIALIPLRMFAGGYHASSRMRCAIISIILTLCALFIIRYGNLSISSSLIVGFIEAVLLFCLIPIDSNEPLEDVERKIYRQKGRRVLITEIIIFVLTLPLLSEVFIAAFSVVLFLSICGIIKNRLTKNPQNRDRIFTNLL